MVVHAKRVALPDLQARAAHRATVGIEYAPAQVQDGPRSALRPTGDLDQIVVRIERQLERVKGARGLPWRRRQGSGASRDDAQPGSRGGGQDNVPPGQAWVQPRHGLSSVRLPFPEYGSAAEAGPHTSA